MDWKAVQWCGKAGQLPVELRWNRDKSAFDIRPSARRRIKRHALDPDSYKK